MEAKPNQHKTARDRVAQWLDTSGAALELRVARELRRVTPFAFHSRYYQPKGSDKAREIDVMAKLSEQVAYPEGDAFMELMIVVECKAVSDPWVLYRFHKPLTDARLARHHFNIDAENVNVERLDHIEDIAMVYTSVWAYQIATTGNRNNDVAYDAVRQVRSATRGVQRMGIAMPGRGLRVYVPVIVTSAPLFAVDLAADGDINIEPVERMMLISHDDGADRNLGTWIVNETGLTKFVDDARDSVRVMRLRPE